MALSSKGIFANYVRSGLRFKNTAVQNLPQRQINTSSALYGSKQAGSYKVTIDRSKPLTYEQAMKPSDIAVKKGFNSFNTAQLEGTFLEREAIGQDLPHKTLLEDMFIRKFLHGTWPEMIVSEVIIKRHHNLVRIATIIKREYKSVRQVYFLIGYSEELLSYWLKCPVKMELQSVETETDLVFKYI